MKIGSHLIVSKGVYDHHGIYIGRGKVIHYSGLSDGLSAGPIEKTTLEVFASGSSYSLRLHPDAKYSGKEVVERAVSRLGEDSYDLHANNCEHFCNWVIYGSSRSSQVNLVEDVADVLMPSNTLLSGMKVRKHLKQKDTNKSELTSDIAEKAAIGALMAVVPVTIPVYVGIKLIKRLFK